MTFRKTILCSTLFPVVMGFSISVLAPCRAVAANPQAIQLAQNPCAANPCAANPCAANPCAANPCAANPCAANPCAANPCAANPCAANPCAANPCAANPCAANPCAAADEPKELSPAQLNEAWERLIPNMKAFYDLSGNSVAKQVFDYEFLTTQPYQSSTHGSRFVQVAINEKAKDYKKFEDAPVLPEGAILAKPSISFAADGSTTAGPLFLMEKMPKGWNSEGLDWKYTLILPNGAIYGETKGVNSNSVTYCIDCHNGAEETDGMFFPYEEFRK